MQMGTRTLIYPALLVALLVLSYMLMFQPRMKEMERVREQTRVKREKLAALEQTQAQARTRTEEIEKLKKAIAFFESKLPDEKEMDKILNVFWEQAEANGLKSKSIRQLKPEETQGYCRLPINMTMVGPWVGLFKFFQSVENLPRVTQINQMKIEKDPKVEGVVSAEFTLTIFFEKNKKVAVAQ